MYDAASFGYSGILARTGATNVKILVARSLRTWLQDEDWQPLAAEWYSLSQELCRHGISIDELTALLEGMRPESMSLNDCGPHSWGRFRDAVRYYVVRGYQDAIR